MGASISVLLLPLGGVPTFLGAGRRSRRPFALRDQRFFTSAALVLAAGLELRARQERLERRARTDELTGLFNRGHLLAELDARAPGQGGPGSMGLLLVDLDAFKAVNDTVGHEAGDELLRTVAARLTSVVRPGDLVVRMAGDEFAVLCEGIDEPTAVSIAERILAAIAQPALLSGGAVHPRSSIGIALRAAEASNDSTAFDPAQFLVQADLAMYQAKADGGQRVVVHDEVLHEQVQRRVTLEHALRRALPSNQLHVAFQPIVYLADGVTHAVEALVRWNDPELGAVAPSDIIAVAERSTLVCDLDAWVLAQAARCAVRWSASARGPLRVSVNFSARNLDDPCFVTRVRSILAEAGCPCSLIVAEITETHLLNEAASDVIHQLRALGVQVAIDDYGVGYSSMARLTRLPFGVLKIDRTFVAGMLEDPGEAAVVRSTIGLAHELRKVVVAEGVETEDQLRALAHLGCDAVQGYLLGRPVDETRIDEWLALGFPVDVPGMLKLEQR